MATNARNTNARNTTLAAALRSLIEAGVVVVDGDDRHHAEVRGLGGGGSYVKSLGGDYDVEHSSPPTFSHGDDNGTWRVVAVRPDMLTAIGQ